MSRFSCSALDHHPGSLPQVEEHAAAVRPRVPLRGAEQSAPRRHHPPGFRRLFGHVPDEDFDDGPVFRFPAESPSLASPVACPRDHRSRRWLSGAEQQDVHREDGDNGAAPSVGLHLHRHLLLHQRLQRRVLREGAEGEEAQQHLDPEHPALLSHLLLLLSDRGHVGFAPHSRGGLLCGLRQVDVDHHRLECRPWVPQ